MKQYKTIFMFFVSLWLAASSCMAETYKERRTEGLYLSIEQYLLHEFDDAENDLRGENGQRMAIGYSEDNLGWNHPGIIYQLSAQGTLGVVFYQDSQPRSILGVGDSLASKADYMGLTLEYMMGQRYGYLVENNYLEIMAGAEGRMWARNIRNGGDNTGFAEGVKDVVGSFSPQISIALTTWWRGMRQSITLGVKYPLFLQQLNVDSRSLLSLKGGRGFFGHLDLTRLFRLKGHWVNLRLYVDTNHIMPSGSEYKTYTTDKVLQVSGGMRITYDFM